MAKRVFVAVMMIALIGATVMAAGRSEGAAAASTTVMRLSTNHPDNTPASLGYQLFARRVNELTNGSVQVEIFYSSVLGSEREVMEQVQAGAIEMTHISAGFLASFVPMVDVFMVPYLFRSHEHYWKVLRGPVGAEIIAAIDATPVRHLYWVEGGSRSFYNNVRPITSPADLRGMTIRVMGSETMLRTMQILGATPTTTAFAEVYSALQTRVIDGAENSATSVSTMKHNEVSRFFSLNEHMKIPDMLLINGAALGRLTPQQQNAVRQAALEAEAFTRDEWNRQEASHMDIIRRTTQINEIPDKSAFIAATAPLHQELGPKFGGLIDRIKAVQ